RIETRPLRHRPTLQDPFELQAEIIMEVASVMFLNDERTPFLRRNLALRLRSAVKVPLSFVFAQSHGGIVRAHRVPCQSPAAAVMYARSLSVAMSSGRNRTEPSQKPTWNPLLKWLPSAGRLAGSLGSGRSAGLLQATGSFASTTRNVL